MRSIKASTLAAFVLLLTGASCVDMDTLNGGLKNTVEAQNTKMAELQKAVADLNGQIKTLNEENNSVKVLLSKVSDHVVAQQTKIDEMDGTIKSLQASRSAPSRSSPAPRRR